MTAKPVPAPPSPALPPSLAANPKLSSWVNFAADGEVLVCCSHPAEDVVLDL